MLNSNPHSWRFYSYSSIFLEAGSTKCLCAGWVTPRIVTRDSILVLLDKATYYLSTERDKKLYLSERERRVRRGKTSVQTITTRKLDEKKEVKVLGGIPNMSVAWRTTYQLHTGQVPRGNPICLEEVTKEIEPGKWSEVPCNKTYQRAVFRSLKCFLLGFVIYKKPPTLKWHKESLIRSELLLYTTFLKIM